METTKNGLRIASKHATTKLERAALAWLNDSAKKNARFYRSRGYKVKTWTVEEYHQHLSTL